MIMNYLVEIAHTETGDSLNEIGHPLTSKNNNSLFAALIDYHGSCCMANN